MKRNQKGFLELVAGLVVLVVAVAIALIIVAFRRHEGIIMLTGPAMDPTIHAGQQVRVHKYPSGQTPQRGDIVEYTSTSPAAQKYAPSGKIISRVVGLPGEKVKISNNVVTVYNSQNPNGFNPDTYLNSSVKTYPDQEVTVAQGAYFLLGDNRPVSLDSREVGTVPLTNIIGKVSY